MAEYLIRTAETREWPAFHRTRNAEVLLPASRDCTAIDGWGDFRMQCGSAEIAFSGEMVGWHVVVDGAVADVEGLLSEVTEQVALAVGVPCEWVRID